MQAFIQLNSDRLTAMSMRLIALCGGTEALIFNLKFNLISEAAGSW